MFHYSKIFNLRIYRYYSNLNILNESKNISLVGWITSIIKLKNKTFIKIQDGRSHENLQAVINNDIIQNKFIRGDCIKLTGDIIVTLDKTQDKELHVNHYELLSDSKQYNNLEDHESIEKLSSSKNTGLKPELIRKDLLHLRHRLNYISAVGRIRANIKQYIRIFMLNNGYLEVDPPHLTKIDSEGAGETFKAIIEGSKDNINAPSLSVSAQLHLEALVLGYSKVYTLGPVFRANKSKTKYHLSEFLMLEVESVDMNNIDEVCNEIELLIKYLINNFLQYNYIDMKIINQSNLVESIDDNRKDFLQNICDSNFLRISFNDAMEILKRDGILDKFEDKPVHLNKAQEQHLVKLLGGLPVFITNFPENLKPFYCKRNPNEKTALAVDLLLPSVGEVVGGTVREDDWTTLKMRIQQANLKETDMKWYLDLRSIGGCPHAGFGLGFDRFVQFLTGISNIQDVVTFPRMYDTCIL